MSHKRIASMLVAVGWALPAGAQSLVYQFGAEATSLDDFAWSVGDAGDVDGDGHPDVVVGAPFDDANGTSSGSVYVYSGRTGALIWTRAGEFPGDAFGWAVDGIGDLDGDGLSEVIASAPLFDFNGGGFELNGGKVYVLRANGTVKTSLSVNQSAAQLGSCVRGLGDIDGDGVPDWAYGSAFYDKPLDTTPSLPDSGRVTVFSGAGTTHLFTRYGLHAGDRFGQSLDVLRATGSQATSRLIVGEPGVDGSGTDMGQARIFDGFGNTYTVVPGFANVGLTGTSVAGLGDADGDGVEDYAVGTPYVDILFAGTDAGQIRVYSGADHSVLFSVSGPGSGAKYGTALAGCGDVNGDGRADLLHGAPDDSQAFSGGGIAQVVSGATGFVLAQYAGGSGDHLGRSVSSAGDLNLDGTLDWVIGAPDAPFGEGRAAVHLANFPAPAIYCTAKQNSLGCTPQISWQGAPSLTIANTFHVLADGVLNQKNGMLFWGLAPAAIPFQGGTLCIAPPTARTPLQNSAGSPMGSDCTGHYDFHFSQAFMSSVGFAPGQEVCAQFWSRDPGSPSSTGLTDAVSFDVVL